MKATAVAVSLCACVLFTGPQAIADTVNSGNQEAGVTTNHNATSKAKKTTRAVSKSGKVVRAKKSKHAGSPKQRAVRRGKYLALARQLKPSGLPLAMVDAVITMESGYRPNARGRHGEIGLMQIKPATARMVRSLTGVGGGSLSNPSTNLRVGMAYLNWCRKKANGNVAATIGCYNAGPGNMWKWKKFAVTRKYVRHVHQHMASN